jgi:hypothetical protein
MIGRFGLEDDVNATPRQRLWLAAGILNRAWVGIETRLLCLSSRIAGAARWLEPRSQTIF